MKYTAIIFLFLSSFSFGQIDQSGFGEIRMGKSYDDLKKRITLIETVPDYAWFAPLSANEYMLENGNDTTGYSYMLENERGAAENEGNIIVWCTFNKKQDANFFNYPIECGQLVFTEDGLSQIMIVFNKKDMKIEAKAAILRQIAQVLGEPICSYTASLEPKPFSCSWYGDGTELLVSDQNDSDLGRGESLNISFLSF